MTQELINGDDLIENGIDGRSKTLVRYPNRFSVTLDNNLNDRLLRLCYEKNLDKTAVVRAALARLLPKFDEKTEGEKE